MGGTGVRGASQGHPEFRKPALNQGQHQILSFFQYSEASIQNSKKCSAGISTLVDCNTVVTGLKIGLGTVTVVK